jgi:hypothetical protein
VVKPSEGGIIHCTAFLNAGVHLCFNPWFVLFFRADADGGGAVRRQKNAYRRPVLFYRQFRFLEIRTGQDRIGRIQFAGYVARRAVKNKFAVFIKAVVDERYMQS